MPEFVRLLYEFGQFFFPIVFKTPKYQPLVQLASFWSVYTKRTFNLAICFKII